MERYIKRLLLVIPFYRPSTGGIETCIENLSSILKKNNIEVQIITSRYEENLLEEEIISNITVRRALPDLFWSGREHRMNNFFVMLKLLTYIKALFKIDKLIQEFKPQVINIFYPIPLAIYFIILSYFHKFSIIISLHGETTLSVPFLCSIEKWLFEIILKKADYITACSKHILEETVKIIPQIKNKSVSIYNGIFAEDYLPKKESLEWIQKNRYILTIANSWWYKGIDILLMAMRTVFDNIPDIDLIIIGDGGDKQKLIEMSQLLKIENKVIFKGFVKDEMEKKRLLWNCEFFVLPSRTEPFGIVNLEAMAAGKAIVSTRSGGIPEVVEDGINGLLCKPYDDESLAKGIINLLRNKELRDELGSNGRKTVKNPRFSWNNIAQQYIEIYNQVLEER